MVEKKENIEHTTMDADRTEHITYLFLITVGNEIVCCLTNLVMTKLEVAVTILLNKAVTYRSF
jgi:hypothetical protein